MLSYLDTAAGVPEVDVVGPTRWLASAHPDVAAGNGRCT